MFLDFDGTISTGDVGVHLLERLGADGWRAVDAEYDAGEIGSRVCLLDEWDLLPHDGSGSGRSRPRCPSTRISTVWSRTCWPRAPR